MKAGFKTVLGLVAVAAAAQVCAQATLYEHEGFYGRRVNAERRISDLNERGFNDRASSLVIHSDRWQVCEDSFFNGQCVVLGPGSYPSLSAMGLNDRVSSVRAINVVNTAYDRDDDRAPPYRDFRRRDGERLYSANVVSVRAVVGPPDQRCWVERDRVDRRANVPGALAGALIGGILGHQIGGGSGRDLATAGGAVAGAVIGGNARSGSGDVQRCANVRGNVRPDFWDVTYVFRGEEHHVQTTEPPGSTITVNGRGEPRLG